MDFNWNIDCYGFVLYGEDQESAIASIFPIYPFAPLYNERLRLDELDASPWQ